MNKKFNWEEHVNKLNFDGAAPGEDEHDNVAYEIEGNETKIHDAAEFDDKSAVEPECENVHPIVSSILDSEDESLLRPNDDLIQQIACCATNETIGSFATIAAIDPRLGIRVTGVTMEESVFSFTLDALKFMVAAAVEFGIRAEPEIRRQWEAKYGSA